MGKAAQKRKQKLRRAAVARPHRSASSGVPRIKGNSDRRKVCFYEYGIGCVEGQVAFHFVDVISGDSDLVDYVGFRFWPSGETHNIYSRTPIVLPHGKTAAHRFLLPRQKVKLWSKKATIAVFGKGGSMRHRYFRARQTEFRERPVRFLETRKIRQHYNPCPDIEFGVELELSLHPSISSQDFVSTLKSSCGIRILDFTDNYRLGRQQQNHWKLVSDASLVCSLLNPNCNKLELVSPVLNGDPGLENCNHILTAMNESFGREISLNLSMAMHIHVRVNPNRLEWIKNICLNAIKYEQAIDTLMPPSRQDELGAGKYCRSNRNAMLPGASYREKHLAIIACKSMGQLCALVNPVPNGEDARSARYYKFNLQNLASGRQPTIEFRQHSCTTDREKVDAWVRFCTRFVKNSTYRPRSLKPNEDAFEHLFDTLIEDVKLKEFYRKRRDKFESGERGCGCQECANHGTQRGIMASPFVCKPL